MSRIQHMPKENSLACFVYMLVSSIWVAKRCKTRLESSMPSLTLVASLSLGMRTEVEVNIAGLRLGSEGVSTIICFSVSVTNQYFKSQQNATFA